MKINFNEFKELSKKSVTVAMQHFSCSENDFEKVCFRLKNQFGYLWLSDIVAHSLKNSKLQLDYYFYYIEGDDHFCISLDVDSEKKFRSIAHLWANASELEQEINEFFGLEFSIKYENQFFDSQNNTFPMLKDSQGIPSLKQRAFEGSDTIVFANPFHNLQIELNEGSYHNQICKVTSGNFHIGFEKALEGIDIRRAATLLEGYFPKLGSLYSLLLFQGIEAQKNIIVPERVMALRMVMLEFIRILDHFSYMQEICLETKYNSLFKSLSIWIKRIQALTINFSGNEHFSNLNRLGGMNRDVDQSWLSRVMDEVDEIDSSLSIEYKAIVKNNKLRDLLGFHIIDKYEATSRCLSGPVARCAGLNFDYRKSHPMYFYGDVEFEVPIGTEGIAFDLLIVKIEEVFQSLKIIIQVLDNLPSGSIVEDSFEDFKAMKGKISNFDNEKFSKGINSLTDIGEAHVRSMIEGPSGLMGISSNIRESKIQRLKLQSIDGSLRKLFEYNSKSIDSDMLGLGWLVLGANLKLAER